MEKAMPLVAVLPFKAAGTEDSGFLASGLHDDLLTRLAKLDAFRVISRTSVMEYAQTTKNIREIGKELGAGYILEGGVQARGKRVRINAQLIDAKTDKHLWAESYDRELTAVNLFDIQADLAVAIAEQLEITLSDSARALINDIPTQSTEAYTAYIRGLELRERSYSADNQTQVEAAFEEAVRLDRKFALAWARLSQARSESSYYTTDATKRRAIRALALVALERARDLQPDLLETTLALADYHDSGTTSGKSAVEILQALEALGKGADASAEALELKAEIYGALGRYSEGYQALIKAQRLAPRSIDIARRLVNMAIYDNNCDAAGWHAQAALTLAPENDEVKSGLANYELQCTGDYGHANELLRGVDVRPMGRHHGARMAARAARDYERLYEISKIPISGPWSILTSWRLLVQYDALRHLGRDREAAATLDLVGEDLAAEELKGTVTGEPWYPPTKALYYAMRRDPEEVRHWIEIDRQLYEQERARGDFYDEGEGHFHRARIFAEVDLNDEAIEELRLMFDGPGVTFTFRYVDAQPWFDELRDHPGYSELRERYGKGG